MAGLLMPFAMRPSCERLTMNFGPLKRIALAGNSQVIDKVVTGLAVLSLLGLVGMASMTLLDIVMRAVSSHGIRGLFELNSLLMAIIIAGFISLVFIRNHNITVDIMKGLAGENQLAVKLVSSVLEVVVLIGFAVVFGLRAAHAYEFSETTTVLGLSTTAFWLTAFILVLAGSVLVLSRVVAQWGQVVDEQAFKQPGFWRGFCLISGAVLLALGLLYCFLDEGHSSGVQAVVAFTVLYILIAAQVPVGISLALLGMWALAFSFGPEAAVVIAQNELSHAVTSMDLAAIPLFLLMGNFATWAGLSGDIFRAGSAVVGARRGGLVIASVIGCGAFGAISGSSIATTVTFGKVAFNEMEKRNYAHSLAAGCIAAGGTLGALIPPSVVLIVYCIVVEVSIQTAFQAALIPGLLALLMYIVAVIVTVRINPELAPTLEKFDAQVAKKALLQAWRPIFLFVLVLGGLYGGVFTTQEAASVGAMLALGFALTSDDFDWGKFRDSLIDTALNSGAIYAIFIGANIFASFMSFSDVAGLILSFVDIDNTPHWLVLLSLVVFYLLLGTVFDTLAAILVTTPLVIPIILGMDYDLVWWGVVTLSLVEVGMITPPLGMNVFVMHRVVGDRLALNTIFKGIVPFLCADLVRILLLVCVPAITLWLPSVLNSGGF